MTKIEFKNLPDTSTPLNASNLNTLQDNVEDAINNITIELDDTVSTSSTNGVENQAITNYVDTEITGVLSDAKDYTDGKYNYSTTEQRIGTWFDGKPLYRQVLHKVMSSTSDTQIGTIDNVDTIITGGNSVAKWDSGAANYFMGTVNSYESSSNYIKIYNIIARATHQCRVMITASEKAELWVECLYTKSTD